VLGGGVDATTLVAALSASPPPLKAATRVAASTPRYRYKDIYMNKDSEEGRAGQENTQVGIHMYIYRERGSSSDYLYIEIGIDKDIDIHVEEVRVGQEEDGLTLDVA